MIKPFLLNEFDWIQDTKSGKTVLISPWFGEIGIWFDVPQPILPDGLKQINTPMPDRIVSWTDNRANLVRELLVERLNAESVS